MRTGPYVIAQVTGFLHRETLNRQVKKFGGHYKTQHFGCRQQFIAMAFAQLTWREGLRDIVDCLNANPEALHHLGFTGPLAKSTLADANESRDWRIWEGVAKSLMKKARKLYADEELDVDLAQSIYALDSSTVDLSLTLFPWASFRQRKAGIKLHTQIDLRGSIPTCIHVSEARKHDVKWLDSLVFEPGAIYLIDRGYLDFGRLARIHEARAFFVIRAKRNTVFHRQTSRTVDPASGVTSDQTGLLGTPASREAYPWPLRRVRYRDPKDGKVYVFLTNLHDIGAVMVPTLYRMRWRIELFFRWIKQHLRIKHFYGNSPNAVKTQIWISVSTYLIVAILHKELRLPGTLHRTFQVLSVNPFSQHAIHEILMENDFKETHTTNSKQLMLWDL
jgi:hypothetical protein